MSTKSKWIVTSWKVKTGHKHGSIKHVETEVMDNGSTWTKTNRFPFTAENAVQVKLLKKLATELNKQRVDPDDTDSIRRIGNLTLRQRHA